MRGETQFVRPVRLEQKLVTSSPTLLEQRKQSLVRCFTFPAKLWVSGLVFTIRAVMSAKTACLRQVAHVRSVYLLHEREPLPLLTLSI
jgi:hypothetical protein